jgi:hypothetical protein
MCLITEQKKPIKIREDMTVYKNFRFGENKESFKPWNYIFKYSYKLNNLHAEEMTYDNCFQSWTDGITAEKYHDAKREEYTHVHKGFHSASTYKRAGDLAQVGCIIKCIIPKGSLIFKDKTGLMVSNQIILKEIVK